MTEDNTKHTPGPWHRYAREPRIRVSATGQSTGPSYTKETVSYFRADIVEGMFAALKGIIVAYQKGEVGPFDEAIAIGIKVVAKADPH